MARRRSSTALTRPPAYTVEILGRRFPVSDMLQASKIVDHLRDQTGMGSSEMGSRFVIREDDRPVGYVSYNGRVWVGDPKSSTKAVVAYDPGASVRKNPSDAENDAEYTRGWKDGLRMLEESPKKATDWEFDVYRNMDEPSWFDMGRADVIAEYRIAHGRHL